MSTIIDTASGGQMNLQAETATAVTSSDTATFSPSTLYVGVAGNVNVVPSKGTSGVLFQNISAGTILPVQVKQLLAASTTASGCVILR